MNPNSPDPGLIIPPSRNVDIGAIVSVSARLNARSIQMSLVQTMRWPSLLQRDERNQLWAA
jgi:hypothetical protein